MRRAAEDVTVGDVLFERGAHLGAAEVGLLASVGVERVRVARRPRVAILATGSELVAAGSRWARARSATPTPSPPTARRSRPAATRSCWASRATTPTRRGACIAAALENDVVITSGGVSVGDYDFVKQVQDELGVERRFWGVATKPGKPLAFGARGDTLVFGVPGNPVAAMVSFEMYVRPALLAMQGRPDVYRPWFRATAAEPVRRTKERTEARRCRLTHEDGAIRFTTTGPQGSGILSSMAGARALLRAARVPGADAGAEFLVMLLGGTAASARRSRVVPRRAEGGRARPPGSRFGRRNSAGARRQHRGVPDRAGVSGHAPSAAAASSPASPTRPAGGRRCRAACRS